MIWRNYDVQNCNKNPFFRRLDETEMGADPCAAVMWNETEEGKKVERAGTVKYYAAYERIRLCTQSVFRNLFFITLFHFKKIDIRLL